MNKPELSPLKSTPNLTSLSVDKLNKEEDPSTFINTTKPEVKCFPKVQKQLYSDVPHWFKIFNYRGEKVINCFESYLLPHLNINLEKEHEGSSIPEYHMIKLFFKIRTYYRAILSGRIYMLDHGFQYKLEEYDNKTLVIMAIPSSAITNLSHIRRLDNALNWRFLHDVKGKVSENIRIVMPENKLAINFGEPILISIPVSPLWFLEQKPSLHCVCSDLPKTMEILQPTCAFKHKNLCIYKKIVTFKWHESQHPHYFEHRVSKQKLEEYSKDENKKENVEKTTMIEETVNIENVENVEKPIDYVNGRSKELEVEESETPESINISESINSNKIDQDESIANSTYDINDTEEVDVQNCESINVYTGEVDSENVGDLLVLALSG